jgi:glutamate-ammonia-ligase adenylyltransferase
MLSIMTVNNTNSLPPQLLLLKNKRLQEFELTYPETFLLLNNELRESLGRFFALSDFGFEMLMRHGNWLVDILEKSLLTEKLLDRFITVQAHQLLLSVSSESELEKALRQCRNFFQTIIAWRDMCGFINIEQSLIDVSTLAETLIIGARNCLVKILEPTWGRPFDEKGNEQPLMILGMGKLGGRELNFSSDIDLIFSFPHHGNTHGGRRSTDNQQYFVKLGQKLVNALDKMTYDGFVYRVDMRLRPFGNSGPLVVSYAALEDYYQSQGRDWERYAMVKARVLGNDTFYKNELKQMIRPFMFRRYIDFSAIESLRKMKVMISHEVRRRGLVDNIKLGSGGIREVEFIVQVFQMIRGGREPQLQEQSLLITLETLADLNILTNDDYQQLLTSYLFLRLCEQTLQQICDKQTQTLPDNQLDWQRLLVITNQSSESEFRALLSQHCQIVEQQFANVVGQEDEIEEEDVKTHQVLSMLSEADDDFDGESLLFELGCQSPQQLFSEIKSLKNDLSKRRVGVRGQEAMGKLIPLLLQQLIIKDDGYLLYRKIGNILKTIATRTAYIELLLENPGALNQLVSLCEASGWISQQLTLHPILLDELLDPKSLYSPTPLSDYGSQLRQYLMRIPEDDMEQIMEGLRQYKQCQQLRIAAADVTGAMEVMKVSDHLTSLAQAIIAYVIDIAWQQLIIRYGEPKFDGEDKGFAVIGYGKLGGIELGYGSDLDLVFVHSGQAGTMTNGDKQVENSHFYMKLAQRILHLFNTRTVSGILYELDMRLRPSGSKGLMVSHIDSFVDYQQSEAWVWEHQALVRTRIVCGSAWLTEKFNIIRQGILCQPRDISLLQKDVAKMRVKMRDHLTKGNTEIFDLKQDNGGIADIEFIAQFLVLGYSSQFSQLTQFSDNVRVFEQAAQLGLISDKQNQTLSQAYQAYRHKGHRLVLNDLQNQTSNSEFDMLRNAVSLIWRQFMLTPVK